MGWSTVAYNVQVSRRLTFIDQAVTYGALGATMATDFLRYPPRGFRPTEHTVKIGSGRERYDRAVQELFGWVVQTGAGIRVKDQLDDTGEQYRGLPNGHPDLVYDLTADPDAPAPVRAGTTATLARRGLFVSRSTTVRVVYVVQEERRVAYGLGTAGRGPESGEEAFIIELQDDDSVWFTIRTVMHTRSLVWIDGWWTRRVRQRLIQRELRSLHPAFV